MIISLVGTTLIFLSTPSARRATGECTGVGWPAGISIHALREEGDWCLPRRKWKLRHFYPRPPRGGRPVAGCKTWNTAGISIHALREEGDSKNGEKHLRFCFIIKRSAQIWKSFSKNIRKNSCNLHRTA